MPQIIIQANQSGNDSADATLSERVVAANLNSPHLAAQLIERLAWATADAEAIESQLHRRALRDRRSASRARPTRLVTSALVLVIATALSLASVAVAHPLQRHHGSRGNRAGQTVAGVAVQWYDITNQAIVAAATPSRQPRAAPGP